MNVSNSLSKEMVKYMLAIFGLSDKAVYNTIGIIKDEFKTNSVIKTQYDGEDIEKHPIFSASASFNSSKFHVIGCSVADEDGAGYCALFKLDNLYTYGIKLDITNDDFIFLVSKVSGNWSKLSMYEKIIACAGLEKLNDSGLLWKKEDIGDFYNTLVELVEM